MWLPPLPRVTLCANGPPSLRTRCIPLRAEQKGFGQRFGFFEKQILSRSLFGLNSHSRIGELDAVVDDLNLVGGPASGCPRPTDCRSRAGERAVGRKIVGNQDLGKAGGGDEQAGDSDREQAAVDQPAEAAAGRRGGGAKHGGLQTVWALVVVRRGDPSRNTESHKPERPRKARDTIKAWHEDSTTEERAESA